MTPKTKFVELEELTPITESGNHLQMNRSHDMNLEIIPPTFDLKWENLPQVYILRKILHGPPPTSQRYAVVRSTGILTLDHLPTPVPWTASSLRFTPVSCHTINSTKPLLLFYSPTETVSETRHMLICMKSRSTTQKQLSWFLINMILLSSHATLPFPSHPSWSLITSCLVVFDF